MSGCTQNEVTRGTTPTFICAFKTIDVDDLAVATLTMKRNGVIYVKKELADAEKKSKALTWTLTQEDSLKIRDEISVLVNWVTNSGLRGTSKEKIITIKHNHIEEVLHA